MTLTTRWGKVKPGFDRVLADLIHAAAETAGPESLELARATLHRQLDDAIDREALRYPSPRRLITRAARYADLCAELWKKDVA